MSNVQRLVPFLSKAELRHSNRSHVWQADSFMFFFTASVDQRTKPHPRLVDLYSLCHVLCSPRWLDLSFLLKAVRFQRSQNRIDSKNHWNLNLEFTPSCAAKAKRLSKTNSGICEKWESFRASGERTYQTAPYKNVHSKVHNLLPRNFQYCCSWIDYHLVLLETSNNQFVCFVIFSANTGFSRHTFAVWYLNLSNSDQSQSRRMEKEPIHFLQDYIKDILRWDRSFPNMLPKLACERAFSPGSQTALMTVTAKSISHGLIENSILRKNLSSYFDAEFQAGFSWLI